MLTNWNSMVVALTVPFRTGCCIVGGGPAGMMLGFLLAREGIPVTVLEKHSDFFRDFRGDTVHPSTLDVLAELDLLDDFLRLPHQRVTAVGGVFGDYRFTAARLEHLPTRCRYVVLMPQWDFLNFLSERAKQFPSFELRMDHEGIDLIREKGRVAGVMIRKTDGALESIGADLVVACDGRHSAMRRAAQLPVKELGVPIDVLWFRIRRAEHDPSEVFGNINYGKVLILIDRGSYFQAGLIIEKGSLEKIKQTGIEDFRANICRIAPYLHDRVNEIKDWEQIKLLSVRINHLERWSRPGLLCIGDAAHAMSPAFGVGINLAIQDAVAAARVLANPLKRGMNVDTLLCRVQQRREFPTRTTQFLQMLVHKGFERVFHQQGPMRAPAGLRIVLGIPGIQWLIARVVGVGLRPEHVGRLTEGAQQRVVSRVRRAVAALVGVSVAAHFLFSALAGRSRNGGLGQFRGTHSSAS